MNHFCKFFSAIVCGPMVSQGIHLSVSAIISLIESNRTTVCPMKYNLFVVLYFVVVMLSIHSEFMQYIYSYYSGLLHCNWANHMIAIISLPQWQWTSPKGYGRNELVNNLDKAQQSTNSAHIGWGAMHTTYSGRRTGPCLNIKTVLSTYGDFHVKDKTAVRTCYL